MAQLTKCNEFKKCNAKQLGIFIILNHWKNLSISYHGNV